MNSDLTTETRYNPEGAQARYDTNKTAKGMPLKIGKDHKLAEHIEKKIADEKYSPCAVLEEIITEGLEFTVTLCRATQCYYCHPRNPQERGSNEKQNQMLRRWFPKGTSFDEIPDSEIERVTTWLNNYPRKLFEWGCSQILFDRAIMGLSSPV